MKGKTGSVMFQKWADRILDTALDRNLVQYAVRIVPATLCAMRYVNYKKHLPEDEASESEKRRKE